MFIKILSSLEHSENSKRKAKIVAKEFSSAFQCGKNIADLLKQQDKPQFGIQDLFNYYGHTCLFEAYSCKANMLLLGQKELETRQKHYRVIANDGQKLENWRRYLQSMVGLAGGEEPSPEFSAAINFFGGLDLSSTEIMRRIQSKETPIGLGMIDSLEILSKDIPFQVLFNLKQLIEFADQSEKQVLEKALEVLIKSKAAYDVDAVSERGALSSDKTKLRKLCKDLKFELDLALSPELDHVYNLPHSTLFASPFTKPFAIRYPGILSLDGSFGKPNPNQGIKCLLIDYQRSMLVDQKPSGFFIDGECVATGTSACDTDKERAAYIAGALGLEDLTLTAKYHSQGVLSPFAVPLGTRFLLDDSSSSYPYSTRLYPYVSKKVDWINMYPKSKQSPVTALSAYKINDFCVSGDPGNLINFTGHIYTRLSQRASGGFVIVDAVTCSDPYYRTLYGDPTVTPTDKEIQKQANEQLAQFESAKKKYMSYYHRQNSTLSDVKLETRFMQRVVWPRAKSNTCMKPAPSPEKLQELKEKLEAPKTRETQQQLKIAKEAFDKCINTLRNFRRYKKYIDPVIAEMKKISVFVMARNETYMDPKDRKALVVLLNTTTKLVAIFFITNDYNPLSFEKINAEFQNVLLDVNTAFGEDTIIKKTLCLCIFTACKEINNQKLDGEKGDLNLAITNIPLAEQDTFWVKSPKEIAIQIQAIQKSLNQSWDAANIPEKQKYLLRQNLLFFLSNFTSSCLKCSDINDIFLSQYNMLIANIHDQWNTLKELTTDFHNQMKDHGNLLENQLKDAEIKLEKNPSFTASREAKAVLAASERFRTCSKGKYGIKAEEDWKLMIKTVDITKETLELKNARAKINNPSASSKQEIEKFNAQRKCFRTKSSAHTTQLKAHINVKRSNDSVGKRILRFLFGWIGKWWEDAYLDTALDAQEKLFSSCKKATFFVMKTGGAPSENHAPAFDPRFVNPIC